jgi:prolyl-tRNA synthetase
MEALMHDGKALQMGTSHNLGMHFAKVFDIQYLDRDGQLKYAWQTSWGTSTCMIGGLIMVHGDDRGLKIPPRLAPIQAIVIPIAAHKEGVREKARELLQELLAAGIRAEIDEREQSPGWKFNEWEMKGVPVRIEIGPKDIENKSVVLVRRDTLLKESAAIEGIADTIKKILDDVHAGMYAAALANREAHTFTAKNFDEFVKALEEGKGFIRGMWCGERECEDAIKEKTGATTRCKPFAQENLGDTCVHCGKPAKQIMYFAKAY